MNKSSVGWTILFLGLIIGHCIGLWYETIPFLVACYKLAIIFASMGLVYELYLWVKDINKMIKNHVRKQIREDINKKVGGFINHER
jgi:hypothetical protein